MKNTANARVPAQVGAGLLLTTQQLLLPMIEGIVHSRRELFAWVQQVGVNALKELFELDVVELAGPGEASRRAISLSLGCSADRAAVRWPADSCTLSTNTRRGWRRGELRSAFPLPRHRSGSRAGAQPDPARSLDPRLRPEPGAGARRDNRPRSQQEFSEPPPDRAHERQAARATERQLKNSTCWC